MPAGQPLFLWQAYSLKQAFISLLARPLAMKWTRDWKLHWVQLSAYFSVSAVKNEAALPRTRDDVPIRWDDPKILFWSVTQKIAEERLALEKYASPPWFVAHHVWHKKVKYLLPELVKRNKQRSAGSFSGARRRGNATAFSPAKHVFCNPLSASDREYKNTWSISWPSWSVRFLTCAM